VRYPIIHQNAANDCGPACLAMVAAFHGRQHSIAAIGELAGTDRQGTSLAGLVQAGKAIGFEARGVRATADALDRVDLPAIAHWSEGGRHHFVVVYRLRGKSVTVGDPANGIRNLSRREFLDSWTGILVLLHPTADLWRVANPRWTASGHGLADVGGHSADV
jgi:ATP-binding cassette subfamily B protein